MSKKQLYNDLKRRILTTELEPGAALDETRLSEQYSLSRTPLREVLRQLAGQGYVEIISNRGARVASMNHLTLRNFFLSAPMIYAAIGRLATQNATAAQVEQIVLAQENFHRCTNSNDADGLIYWNDQFHRIMGDMAANPYLQPSYERLLIDHARISQTFYGNGIQHNDELHQADDHHQQMIDCIQREDCDGMIELIKHHWELSRNNMALYVRPTPLPIEDA